MRRLALLNRGAAGISPDRQRLSAVAEESSQPPARCRFPSRWQPHAKRAPGRLCVPVGQILSSPKDPSMMNAVGGSPEDEMTDERGRELRRPGPLCVRRSLAKSGGASTQTGALIAFRVLSRSISPVSPALSTRTAPELGHSCAIRSGVLPQYAVAARCGEIMRDSVRLQPSGS